MCEEDRLTPSGKATGTMLEEMQTLNSDPYLNQYHITNATCIGKFIVRNSVI